MNTSEYQSAIRNPTRRFRASKVPAGSTPQKHPRAMNEINTPPGANHQRKPRPRANPVHAPLHRLAGRRQFIRRHARQTGDRLHPFAQGTGLSIQPFAPHDLPRWISVMGLSRSDLWVAPVCVRCASASRRWSICADRSGGMPCCQNDGFRNVQGQMPAGQGISSDQIPSAYFELTLGCNHA